MSSRYGMTMVYDPADAVVDIILVHGLNGDPVASWTYAKEGIGAIFWPRDLLPNWTPKARIMTWGYNSTIWSFSKSQSLNSLGDFAADLLGDVEMVRGNTATSARPIIFIGQSIGGLIIKSAIVKSSLSLGAVYSSVNGIIFLGTPHMGTRTANYLAVIMGVAGVLRSSKNKAFIKELEENSTTLREMNGVFLRFMSSSNISIVSCYETISSRGVGLVVPRESATLHLVRERVVPLETDHAHLGKFISGDDPNFQMVVTSIARCIDQIQGVTDPPKTEATPPNMTPVIIDIYSGEKKTPILAVFQLGAAYNIMSYEVCYANQLHLAQSTDHASDLGIVKVQWSVREESKMHYSSFKVMHQTPFRFPVILGDSARSATIGTIPEGSALELEPNLLSGSQTAPELHTLSTSFPRVKASQLLSPMIRDIRMQNSIKPTEKVLMRAKLDTGAGRSCLSADAALKAGLRIFEYHGRGAVGAINTHHTMPIGITEGTFHFSDQAYTYEEEFLVLANATFDVLLCERFLLENQLVILNESLLPLVLLDEDTEDEATKATRKVMNEAQIRKAIEESREEARIRHEKERAENKAKHAANP